MIDTKNKKQPDKGIHPAIVGVAGAVVGAGVAVAATMAMKDEKTKKKVTDAFTTVKDKAVDYIDTMKTEGTKQQGKIEEKLEQGKKKVAKITSTAKRDTHKTSTDEKKHTAKL